MIEIHKPDAALAKVLPPVSPRGGIIYVPSQYALPFAQGGKRYVFHNLTKQCIEGVLPASAKAGEGCDELIKAQFLVPADKDECAYYNQISSLMRALGRKKGIRGYTILPTLGCNARCIYCYEEGREQVTMTEETARQVIRFILDTRGEDTVKISWFGGEPLLGTAIIDRICEGLREAGVEYRSSMVSNGSLLTPEIVGRMTGDWRLSKIQISMDGAEEDYRRRKAYRSEEDYYHSVMESVSRMSEAGIFVSIRCNVDPENWGRIPDFLRDLSLGIGDKSRVGLYFAPLNAVRMGEADLELWERIRDAGPWIEEAGFKRVPFMDLGLRFRVNRCMADGGSVVIAPDGALYPCERCPEEARFGDIWHGTTDEEAKKAFCRADRTREKCRTCPFLPDCTNFSSCPIQDTHCRQVHEMMAGDTLRRLAEKRAEEGGENPLC